MAVRFDASGDRLLRTANLPSPTAFGACGWAMLDVDRNASTCFFALESGASSAAATIALFADSDGTSLKLFSPASGGVTSGTLASLVVGQPFFWAVVGNGAGGSGLTAYYRAAGSNTLSSVSIQGSTFSQGALFLGNSSYAEWLNGRIWNAKVWDRAPSAPELLIESYFERPQFPASLNLWLPMPNANDVADRSGNGRNPTVGGTLTTGDSSFGLWRPKQRRFRQAASGGGPTNYTLTCDVGSYALTGVAALLRRGYSLVADAGSYTLTGQDAALRRGYSIAADTGSYALQGQDAALRRGYSLVCDVGAYSLTGQDATLTYSAGGTAYTLTCDAGSYALTGYDAALTYAPGAANYSLTADAGAYALTGNAAILSLGRRMVADVGAYALTGQAANLVYGRRLVCDTGVYSLSGQDADLVYTTTGPIAYSLTCETGAYALNGLDAALVYSAAQADNLTHAAPGLTPKIWPGLSIRYEGKPKQRVEQLDEEERERIEEIAEQAVIEAANERTKKAMKASLQASMRAAEIELAAKSYLHLVEQAALLRMEQIEEEDIAVTLLLM